MYGIESFVIKPCYFSCFVFTIHNHIKNFLKWLQIQRHKARTRTLLGTCRNRDYYRKLFRYLHVALMHTKVT